MKIECKNDSDSGNKSFVIEGELDVHSAKALRAAVMDEIRDDSPTVVLDLGGVAYIDSSGLGILVYLKKEIGRQGGKLVISHLQESVLNVFRLTRLDSFFEIS